MTSRYHSCKFSGSQKSLLTETAIFIVERRKYRLPFCSWVPSCTGKSYMSKVCRDPEILLPRQRDIATSPFLHLQGAAKSVKAQKRKTKKSFSAKNLLFGCWRSNCWTVAIRQQERYKYTNCFIKKIARSFLWKDVKTISLNWNRKTPPSNFKCDFRIYESILDVWEQRYNLPISRTELWVGNRSVLAIQRGFAGD